MVNKTILKIDLENVSANLQTYLSFVKSVEQLSEDEPVFKELVHPEVQFTELPNLLNKNGQVRNLEMSLDGLKKARLILTSQTYEIVGYAEDRDKIVVEKVWTGNMAIDAGNLKKGQQLKAYICAFVEFKDGKIYRHRSYDCYEPF